MKLLILLTLAAAANAACPNACSGHGTCGLSSKCNCQARWVGNDCSQRQCPSGLSWIVSTSNTNVPAGGLLGGYHPYAECSNRGTCDRDSGECVCVEGYEGRGCRRTSCPNACSGHGFCRYNYEINSNYAGYGSGSVQRRYDMEQWDAAKTRQCVCDRGYEGIDCASRICPKGDDPLTSCNEEPGQSINDVQLISFDATGTFGADKFFSLTFRDMYTGQYTTRPIHTAVSSTVQATNDAWAAEIESALEELPNFAIPNVTVTAAYQAAQTTGGVALANQYLVQVTFVDAANSGKQTLLEVSNADHDHDKAGMQPRFVKTGGGSSKITVQHKHSASITVDTGNQKPLGNNKLEEHIECSNRGNCDSGSGLCTCYEGFTGEACNQQTVFF